MPYTSDTWASLAEPPSCTGHGLMQSDQGHDGVRLAVQFTHGRQRAGTPRHEHKYRYWVHPLRTDTSAPRGQSQEPRAQSSVAHRTDGIEAAQLGGAFRSAAQRCGEGTAGSIACPVATERHPGLGTLQCRPSHPRGPQGDPLPRLVTSRSTSDKLSQHLSDQGSRLSGMVTRPLQTS